MPHFSPNKKESLNLPKVCATSWEEYYRYQGLFEKAQEIAVYYGFQPIETPILEHEELFARGVGEHTDGC